MASVLLADDFPLPPAVVTESVSIYGRKGSGKTNTAERLFEQMHKIGAQCVALDPVGKWWGLRLSASGKRAGLDIPVFGGDHGDIPITPQGGKLMAQVVVDRNISCVIDLMNFRPAQRKEFATDFAEELFELKKRKMSPLHLSVEEARLFAPQVMKDKLDVRMTDAFEQIVRLGRNYGLGVSLIDQRPQSVNKEVSSQTEILIVHQMVENLGREAIEKWVRSKKTKGADQLEHLDELRTGEAFVWSPGLLRSFARIMVGKKETYDNSRTPEIGKTLDAAPKPLSSKDLLGLRTAMTDVVQAAEATDPRKLRARVAELELALKQRPTVGSAKVVEKVVEKRVEVPVVDPKLVTQLMDLEKRMGKVLAPIGEHVTNAVQLLARFTTDLEKRVQQQPAHSPGNRSVKTGLTSDAKSTACVPGGHPTLARQDRKEPTTREKVTPPIEGGIPTKAELNIIKAMAWLESIGIAQPSVEQVAFLAGYSPEGGYFNNTRGAMRTKGLLEYPTDGKLQLTAQGRQHAPALDAVLSNEELHRSVLDRLKGPEQRMLKPLLAAYPDSMTLEEHAAAAGFDANGGYYNNMRGRLRTLGVLDYPEKGAMRATDFMFLH